MRTSNCILHRHRFRLGFGILALALLASCAREQAIEKTLLVRLPNEEAADLVQFSNDGEVFAFVEKTENGQRVVGPKGPGPVHTECSRLTFAPKSHQLFYWASDGPNDRKTITLVAGDQEIATELVAPGETVFSDDGARWAVVGARPSPKVGALGEMALLVDGVEVARQDDMTLPAFSPDGSSYAFLALKDNRVRLFIDGAERQGFDAPTAPCAAAALQAARRPDLPLRHVLQFLSDGSLLAITRDADGWGAYRDGLRVASYAHSTIDHIDNDCAQASAVALGSFRKAAHAPASFWWERIAGDAELWRVVRNAQPVDDVTCKQPWRRHPPELSEDGQRLVYACASQAEDSTDAAFLIANGARYGPYQDIWGIAPTKDGVHVAYGASVLAPERPWAIYVDGKVRVDRLAAVWRPRLSDDGATLAWQGKLDDEGRGIFGVNARRIGSFDQVLWGPGLSPDGRAYWMIRRGRKITRVSVPIAALDKPERIRVIATAPALLARSH